MERATVGIDIGGTKILGVLFDPARRTVLARRERPTPRHDPLGLAAAVAEVVDQLARSAVLPGSTVLAGIGLGVPGLVDRRGILRYGPNVPGVVDFDLAAALRQRFDAPIVADNDAAHAALAEHQLGAARGTSEAIVVTQGTGIGGGLILGGRVYRGANGFAGEPGHMLIDADGIVCACGQRGCWETVSSGTALANLARVAASGGGARRIVALAGGDPAAIRGEHVSVAYDEGDADAADVIDELGRWVALGLASLVTLLDPQIIVLGGGLTAINDRFLDRVRAHLMDTVMGGEHRPVVPVVTAELGAEAGAIGGALAAAELRRV